MSCCMAFGCMAFGYAEIPACYDSSIPSGCTDKLLIPAVVQTPSQRCDAITGASAPKAVVAGWHAEIAERAPSTKGEPHQVSF